MSRHKRLVIGLSGALLLGALGPSLVAVAHHSGSGKATISGVITRGGHPARNVCATAWYARDHRMTAAEIFAGSTRAGIDGRYVLGALAADTYKVEFHPCDGQRVGAIRVSPPWQGLSRFWEDADAYELATPIEVGAAQDVTGIDGDL